MSEMTREQFASSVVAAISSVDHLYRELDRLIAGLRGALGEPPHPLALVRGTLGKSGRYPARFLVRYEYGVLLEAVASDGDIEDDEDDGEACDYAYFEDDTGRMTVIDPAEAENAGNEFNDEALGGI